VKDASRSEMSAFQLVTLECSSTVYESPHCYPNCLGLLPLTSFQWS